MCPANSFRYDFPLLVIPVLCLRVCLAMLPPATLALAANRVSQPQAFKSTVPNLPDENLVGSCSFELTIPNPAKPIRAVWITYDRGYDVSRYYSDADVKAFGREHGVALMLAHQCLAKAPPTGEQGEMDMDLSRGVARSIFAALGDFAHQSHHAEISEAKLIVMGFSGIGAMFGHFVAYAPNRILAAVLANPGQTDPYGMKDINLGTPALNTPQFVIAGALDDRAAEPNGLIVTSTVTLHAAHPGYSWFKTVSLTVMS